MCQIFTYIFYYSTAFISIVLIRFKYKQNVKCNNINKILDIKQLFSYNYSFLPIHSNFTKILFFILSSSVNVMKRYKIKTKWGNICRKLSCYYFFVIASKDNIDTIEYENKNDIIGIDIIDSYYNLTILTSNIFKYYIEYKLQSDFIIKNDDDIYPNIPLLNLYVNIYTIITKISGYYYPQMKVSRNKNSTVYLRHSIYSYKIFPNFVAGGFVVIHSSLVKPIYSQLRLENKILYREDMHMGTIYKKLNISFQKLNKYYHRKEKNLTYANKKNDICWHGYE